MNQAITPSVTCPDCGSPMVLRETAKFRYEDGRPRPFYGCSAYPACFATHGAHPDGRPLGTPGDAATKAARIKAHEAFDRLWKGGRMSRRGAYRFMRDLMGMTDEESHIGRFTAEQCETMIARLAGSEATP
jgi:ssDNA-binding Zn-finger/Zn-ribbon topoisomerase 1